MDAALHRSNHWTCRPTPLTGKYCRSILIRSQQFGSCGCISHMGTQRFLLQATQSSIQQPEHHRYPIQGVKSIQDSGDMNVNMASFTFAGLCSFSRAPSTSLHQSLYKIMSSFIHCWKRGKLSYLPLGFRNLHLALVHSLHMGWFHLWCHSTDPDH